MDITSTTNPLVKEIASLKQKKERQKQNLLLAEGQHPIEEALQAGLNIEHLFLREGQTALPQGYETNKVKVVSEAVMAKLSSTDSPPPVIGVIQKPTWELSHFEAINQPAILVLDQLQDPGNVGTLIRSTVAFGLSGIVLTQGTVDPFSPKVIRSSAGLVFRLPVVEAKKSLAEVMKVRTFKDFTVFLTYVDEKNTLSYRTVSYHKSCLLVLGKEGTGLPQVGLPNAQFIQIPMAEGVDSLNVAMSGTVVMAEAFSQRNP